MKVPELSLWHLAVTTAACDHAADSVADACATSPCRTTSSGAAAQDARSAGPRSDAATSSLRRRASCSLLLRLVRGSRKLTQARESDAFPVGRVRGTKDADLFGADASVAPGVALGLCQGPESHCAGL